MTTITLAAVLNMNCADVCNALRIGGAHDLAERLSTTSKREYAIIAGIVSSGACLIATCACSIAHAILN